MEGGRRGGLKGKEREGEGVRKRGRGSRRGCGEGGKERAWIRGKGEGINDEEGREGK